MIQVLTKKTGGKTLSVSEQPLTQAELEQLRDAVHAAYLRALRALTARREASRLEEEYKREWRRFYETHHLPEVKASV